jgi:hypothetical protein
VKLPRRQFLHLAAGAAALPFAAHVTRAQTYPSRPVRLITGFPAGSITDLLARFAAQWLSERLGQPYIAAMPRFDQPLEPMTLGNMRELGVLIV